MRPGVATWARVTAWPRSARGGPIAADVTERPRRRDVGTGLRDQGSLPSWRCRQAAIRQVRAILTRGPPFDRVAFTGGSRGCIGVATWATHGPGITCIPVSIGVAWPVLQCSECSFKSGRGIAKGGLRARQERWLRMVGFVK
jgi:hypothetical protein